MCFGNKSARSGTPPPRPLEKIPEEPVSVVEVSAAPRQPARLTKARPQATAAPVPAERASLDITWPLDRPSEDTPTRVYSPPPRVQSPPLALATTEIMAPRPFRFDDNSVPPSNVPSLYTPNSSRPSTPSESSPTSPYDFTYPPSPPPFCPPTPSSMGESLRVASLMPAPLCSTPARPVSIHRTGLNRRVASPPPAQRLRTPNPPMPVVPPTLARKVTPPHPSPRKTPSPTVRNSFQTVKHTSPSYKHAASRTATLTSTSKPPSKKSSNEKIAAGALSRAKSLGSAMRPKFSLPETLAPFSLAPPPVVMDLYEPPSPPPRSATAPPVPERTATIEPVLSRGRIAVDQREPSAEEQAERTPTEPGYEKIRLFPIPDSIIRGEELYQEERRRRKHAAAGHSRQTSDSSSRSSDSGSSSRDSGSSQHRNSGSSGSSMTGRSSVGDESGELFDSRCPSPVAPERPASVALGQLPSRFSMSTLGSTLRVHQPHQNPGYAIVRPASARPSLGSGSGNGNGGSIPTFPSRHEAKKARKQWLIEQEEAKRQSAKMGVEGILGWDATTCRWVNKMTDDEKEAWLNQWKEKRSAASALALHATSAARHRANASMDFAPRPIVW